MKPGKVLVPPGTQPSVPQWQKSKGCLILTAALELSSNQVTHFYSKAKNTTEMIGMTEILIEKIRGLPEAVFILGRCFMVHFKRIDKIL